MKNKITPIFLTIYSILMLGGAALLTGCGRDAGAGAADSSNASTAVRIAEVTSRTQALPIRTSGRLAGKAEIKLSFKIGGIVERLFVDEGFRVRQGARLARLNLAEIDAQVTQANSGLEKARRDLARAEGLYSDSVATLEQLQDARTAVEVAEAALKIASFNRTHAEIVAPASGRVLKRAAEAGEMVAAGQPIYLFGAERGGWVVRIGVADRDIVKLAVGDSAELVFDPYPGHIFKGWVTEVADAADPLSGTFEVEVSVDDPGRRLKSGFIARVDVFPSMEEAYHVIPAEALLEADGQEGLVYVYDEASGAARKTPVHIARVLDEEIVVSEGLRVGDRVVTDGVGFLKGNGQVRVVQSAE